MSLVAHIEPASATLQRGRIEAGFRRVLCLFSVIAGLGVLGHFGILLWAQNEFSSPESIVGTQAMMLARDGTLYYDLNRYPYTVSAYTPLFYWLEAGFIKLGLHAVTAGRLLSLAATLGIVALVWRLLILYTGDLYCAWTGALLCASTSLVLFWGTVGQVDSLAIFWTIAAFYQYSRYSIRGEKTLLWVGIFAGLAFFTKQTTIACPAAICAHLWFNNRKAATKFGASLAAIVLVLVLIVNAVLGGRFLADTVRANMNPFDLKNLFAQLRYLLIAGGQLVIVTAAGISQARKGRNISVYVYLGAASLVFLLTAAKIGSDTNYQIESTILLVLSACLALHALDFFPLSFRGSKHWVTLLQIPLGIHLILNFRVTAQALLTRIAVEQQLRQQITALRPYIADGGRLLSADYNSTVRLRGAFEVESFIYTILARGGVVDPEPLRRDIAAEAFSTIFLHYDVGDSEQTRDIRTFPPAQTREMQRHYKLVAHIAGPYYQGVYVYKPVAQGAERRP